MRLTIQNCWKEQKMAQNEVNLNGNINVVEARRIIEAVTTLARHCAFNHIEAMKIAKVCQDCCDRLERSENDGK